MLRDHLEAGNAGSEWAYLIPPPVYEPEGPTTARWDRVSPSTDETAFTRQAISYADFGAAVAETSTKDDRVHPAHARKAAARLKELGYDYLYYENIDGGHAAAANLNETAKRQALEYTYLTQQLMD